MMRSTAQVRRPKLSIALLQWMFLPALLLLMASASARAQDDDLIITHGISTFGELRYARDFEHLDYVNPDAPQGGELSFSWSSGSFDSMHPYTSRGRPSVVSSFFYEAMLEETVDEIGSAYGLLAETIAYPEDRSYVIFTIRPEAKFSDGSRVTAQDAFFSYEILRDEGLPSFRASIVRTIASAQVLNDLQIRYDFNPDAPIRGRIESAGGLPVISQASHIASGLAFEESRLEPLIGSAPYMVEDVRVGERVVLRRNPDYWGNDLPINQGRHNFDRIRVEYYGDGIAAFEGFTAGNYTFRQESSSVTWATGYDFPKLLDGSVVRAELPNGVIASGQSFVINTRREKFQDPQVREAIALMFNFEWTNQTLFFDLYSPIYSFWENTEMSARGLPQGEELAILEPLRDQLNAAVFEQEPFATLPSDPDRALDRRKARLAVALLEAAGWVSGADGFVRNAAGDRLEVEFLNSSPLFDRIINPYVENLRAIGIDARLSRVDNAQLTQREREYDFDIITDHYPMGYEPGSSLRQYFGSESANSSIFNNAGVSDPAIDALIEIVIDAETQAEMQVAVQALDRVLRWERFRVPQWYNNADWVSYYDMYEYPDPLPPYSLGFLDLWWINPDKQAELRAAGAF
jgi:microcin C transport system substrate-binding protein